MVGMSSTNGQPRSASTAVPYGRHIAPRQADSKFGRRRPLQVFHGQVTGKELDTQRDDYRDDEEGEQAQRQSPGDQGNELAP